MNIANMLPEGWTVEGVGDRPGFLMIRTRSGNMVTVDLNLRAYRVGLSMYGPITGQGGDVHYRGRGWTARLYHDAFNWLREIESGATKESA